MHNGLIADWPILRRAIEALIPDTIYSSREGTTDSEAIFLAIVGANIEENPVRATETVMRKLKHIMKENGDGHRLRFTAALTNGRDIYAFRYAVNDSANTLYYRSNRSGAVIASEPLDAERANWAAVGENCMLIARRGYPAGVVRFSP